MQTPKVWYVNVFVSDLERALEFWEKKVGLELRHAEREHRYASFDAGPVSLGLARVTPESPEAGRIGRHTGVGLGVADLEAAYEELRERGVRFTMEPTRQPWGGFMGLFADPDGNVFYLDELREEAG